MTVTAAATALSANLSVVPPVMASWYPQVVKAAVAPSGENPELTAAEAAAQDYCWAPMSKGGRCRKTPGHAGSHRRTKPNPRKTEADEQFAFMVRMFKSLTRRAAEEDPGLVLKNMLAMQDELSAAINAAGEALVSQVGDTVVAGELGMSKQNVNKRWGPAARARRAAERFTAEDHETRHAAQEDRS